MPKTYKHKTLWLMAVQDQKDPSGNYTYSENWISYTIRKNIIENSSDREEVVEKDWISKLRVDLEEFVARNGYFTYEDMFRASIEQHAPKQKKFTDEYVWDFVRKHSNPENEVCVRWTLEIFLNENNLLSSDD